VSLRRRLLAGMLVLLIAAVVATDVVTRSYVRSYLYGRLDEQDDVAQNLAYAYLETVYQRALAAGDRAVSSQPEIWLDQLAVPSTGPFGSGATALGLASPALVTTGLSARTITAAASAANAIPRSGRLNPSVLAARISPDVFIEVLDAQGQVVFRRPSGSAEQPDPRPVLPDDLPVVHAPPVPHFGTSHGTYLASQPNVAVGAVGHHGAYYLGEALAVPGGVLVTADAIAPAEQTLASLTRVELLVSVVVVLVVLALTLWTVRLGLRPLDDMTDTARAIAGGELRRRVRRSDERSEVGRLGAALNGMLGQIEAAFAERSASETRLRRFVADASHELRTPLTSIRGYAELLRKGSLEDEAARRRAAERIEHEATRMSTLVDDLLLLARLDQGRPLERESVDLCRVAAEAAEVARAADPSHPLTTDLPRPVVVEGDAGRLRQVVDNLLENARVHTPAGTPVTLSVHRHNGTAELVVADRGPGIGGDEAGRVFDRFHRGAEARGRPGTGLGLSIVAALAAAHGGRARVGPAPGGGAEFVVELPVATSGSRGASAPRSDPGGSDDGTMAGREPGMGEPARR
jgi:two-component system, OmpR family, sensor kinase